MSAGAQRRDGPPPPPTEASLPSNFTDIRAILDENVHPGSMVNVIGVVKDYRAPIPTNGADHKCTLTLCDLSVENENDGVLFNIFRREAEIPQFSAADVVVLTQAKVQKFRSDPLSLITNLSTSIRVYSSSRIPRPPRSAQEALAPALSRRDSYSPSDQVHRYVAYLYHKIDKYALPDEDEFKERASRSLNVKNKFSLLRDVREGNFYDLIVQVATEPYAGFDIASLYVSDYTENPHFHLKQWEGMSENGPWAGDPFGYTSGGVDMPKKEWVGPYGRMSIQITCFEPHASIIRSGVTAGQWLALRNVQIKYGRDGNNLEGFLREDRGSTTTKINVEVLEINNPETIDPRLKEAIRRWRDYSKKKKKQIKDIKAAEAAGQKRKASVALEQEKPEKRPLNSRDRRKLKRAAQERKAKEASTHDELRLNLNDQITCEAHTAPYSTIESILEPTLYETSVNGRATSLAVPFTCAKYQARVRVVDFFPASLESFACCRKQTVFDVLSDNEDDGESSSSRSADGDDDDEETVGTSRIWEWRFALQLEDASPPTDTNKKKAGPRPRLWVLVDNSEAQCLTGLDATDLHQDPKTLALLRERMFTLWGDLEERKTRAAERKRERGEGREEDQPKKRYPRPGDKPQLRVEKPPLESSDEEDDGDGQQGVSNKPFTCCIQQYGVYDGESEEGAKWVRCFGLFGTKICT
ncbi:hypothetical protein VTK56DRAFT_1947 [Thermocarpiscus australiensis]